MERPLGVVLIAAAVFALGTLPPTLLAFSSAPGIAQRFPVHTPCEPGSACTETKRERNARRKQSKCTGGEPAASCAECAAGEACAPAPDGGFLCGCAEKPQ